MAAQRTFVAGKETAGYLEAYIALNDWADPIFDSIVKEYGEDSAILGKFSENLEGLKSSLCELMTYGIASSLALKENTQREQVEI